MPPGSVGATSANIPNAATALPAAAAVMARPRERGGRTHGGAGGSDLMARPMNAPAITASTVQIPAI
jgi:hypothetical protein